MTADSESGLLQLFGRDRERVDVQDLIAALPAGGAALVWTGDRGYGKTAVLESARSLAGHTGLRVLTIRASDPGGLVSTLEQQVGILGNDPKVQTTESHSTSSHVLFQRLSEVSSQTRPVLLCLDDLDLLHPSEVASVLFALRRLKTLPALLLATMRPTSIPELERRDVPILALRPLSELESAQVLAAHYPGLIEEVAKQIVAEASGSPLALLELAAGLTERQRAGIDAVPRPLPLSPRLSEIYALPLESLSHDAREALTRLAVGGAEDVTSLLSADDDLVHPSALDELERAGLLVARERQPLLAFRHPLIRSAALQVATARELTRAADQLATTFPGGSFSETGVGAELRSQRDGHLASHLERSSRRATGRGDVDEGVAQMIRAAHLSPNKVIRSRRLLEAAHLRATITGEMDAAAQAFAEAARADAGSVLSVRAAATSGQLMMAAGGPLDEVSRILIEALAATTEPEADRSAVEACLQLLFYVSLVTARSGQWRVFDHLVKQHKDPGPVVALLSGVLPDVSATTPDTLAQVDAAIESLNDAVNPAEVVGISIAAFHLDRLGPCRAALSRVADDARRGQTVGIGVQAMLRLALDDCQTGQLVRASQLVGEALELSNPREGSQPLWPFQVCLGHIAALQGDQPQVENLTMQMSTWAAPHGATLVDHHCAHLRGLVALSHGDFETAYQYNALINPAGTLARHSSVAFSASLDLVEAAIYSHREVEAAAHSQAMTDAGIARLSPRFALRVATASAITAPDARASELFAQALAIPHADRWPFDQARARLAWGTRLRRLRQGSEARAHLESSYETFRRIGARGWEHRAAQELRAAGIPMPPPRNVPLLPLAGRDLEIVTLAAEGLSNKEIGVRLFLSPRTVAARLYRIFPKLGVSSRAGLRDALDSQPDWSPRTGGAQEYSTPP